MKKQKKTASTLHSSRVHESKDDRSRTLSGKTVNSKVRSEGRALAALERSSLAHRSYSATEAKKLAVRI